MATEKQGRDQSTIAFPYVDLDESIRLAGAILAKGGTPLDRDQLAAHVGQVPNSGAFGAKIGAARMFGLIDVTQAKYSLTDLGFEILDPSREAAAKASAFLNVPLYKRVFEDFRGRQLPPRPQGLEHAFVNMGVAPKQKERARQIFDRSARSAGFFANAAEDRLVSPVLGPPIQSSEEKTERGPPTDTSPSAAMRKVGQFGRSSYHPFIEGLLQTLPADEDQWPLDRRAKWLEAASNIFDLIYGDGGGRIKVSVEGT